MSSVAPIGAATEDDGPAQSQLSAAQTRPARPADIPALMRMKAALAADDGCVESALAGKSDWFDHLFGPTPRFAALVAERSETVAGMLIYGDRFFPGWSGSAITVHDLFVDPLHRRQGIATALLRHLAQEAIKRNAMLMELTVRENNPARRFYDRTGFQHLAHCLTYVITGPALCALVDLPGNLPSLF